jgi:hypothetical protein
MMVDFVTLSSDFHTLKTSLVHMKTFLKHIFILFFCLSVSARNIPTEINLGNYTVGISYTRTNILNKTATSFDGKVTKQGTIAGDFVLMKNDGQYFGTLTIAQDRYEIALNTAGQWQVKKVGAVPEGGNTIYKKITSKRPLSLSPVNPAQGPYRLDVLFIYSAAARIKAGGTTQIENKILQAISEGNQVLGNSQISASVQYVRIQEVEYTEPSSLSQCLLDVSSTSTTIGQTAAALRNQYSADMVTFVADCPEEGTAAGIGYQPSQNAPEYFFTACKVDFLAGSYTWIHEIGHNLGAGHAPGDAGASSTGYNHGYRFKCFGQDFRTIMAYAPGSRIPYFSNPNVLFLGRADSPTGVANANDNVRMLNERIWQAVNARVIAPVEVTVTVDSSNPQQILDADNFTVKQTTGISTYSVEGNSVFYASANTAGGQNFIGWSGPSISKNPVLQIRVASPSSWVAHFADGNYFAPILGDTPHNQTVTAGTTVTLEIEAIGNPLPTYQWKKNGSPISGATTSTLSLPAFQDSQSGYYTVVVSNGTGSAETTPAAITTSASSMSAPTITMHPVNQQIEAGSTLNLSIGANNSDSFQWYLNTALISGANSGSSEKFAPGRVMCSNTSSYDS